MVTFASEYSKAGQVTPCWDNQTHSIFSASSTGMVPLGFRDIEELYEAHGAGHILVVTDRCKWYKELDETLGLYEVAHFDGISPLWSKTPSLRLYTTSNPMDE